MTVQPNILGVTCAAYAAEAKARAEHGGAIISAERYSKLYRTGVWTGPGTLESLLAPVHRTHTSESEEGTVLKFTQVVDPARDGRPALEIESVLIPMIGKKRTRSYTLCVSSQVGCAMGCGFCQTAQMGLIRSLTAAEIVGQWFAAEHLVQRPDPTAPIRNIVFMGMGEPMDNLDAVLAAIEVLTDTRGACMAMSRITISTVGRIDGITKLATRIDAPGWHRLGLAVSLNAPSDEVRSRLMPVNRSMPMADLRRALVKWPFYSGVHLCLEYVLIPGQNDALLQADELAAFVLGEQADPAWASGVRRFDGPALRGLINLIPYNPRDNSPWPAPTEESVDAFMERLKSRGVYVKRRRTKGRDTMAACGQLGNSEVRRTSLRVSATPLSTAPG